MVNVLTPGTLRAFWEQNPAAESPLRAWLRLLQRSTFANWADVTSVFPAADYVHAVRPLVIFNIGGNKFRLVASLDYARQRVYIKHIFTHAEYDAWNKGGRK